MNSKNTLIEVGQASINNLEDKLNKANALEPLLRK
jgi:hypothetical protein